MRPLAAGLTAALLLVPSHAWSATYAVRVRWSPSASAGVTGYRISLSTAAGVAVPVLDAGLPPPAADGSLAVQVSGLDGRSDYSVSVTAVGAGGESVPSNAIAVGYAQVAARIDSDSDGLTDAAEDRNLNRALDAGETDALRADTDGDGVGDAADSCAGTSGGAAVNGSGCSCAQVSCDDANPCNGVETCSAGTCRAGTAPVCNDGNPCTTDSCGPGGCRATPVGDGTSCTNANPCDGAETCHGGTCTPGTPPSCDDGSACTDDACSPQGGCTHTSRPGCCTRDADCSDADQCTTAERCQAGTCVSAPVTCPQPPSACETVRCEADAGCVTDSLPDGAACDDDDACTLGDACLAGACVGALDAPTKGPRGVGIRRFTLDAKSGAYAVNANGYFAFPESIDLATADLGIVFEDGAHRPVLTAAFPAGDLDSTRAGWTLAQAMGGIDRLEVRPSNGTARVSLRGTLPSFALVDDGGVPTDGAGAVFWRVRFGTVCASALRMRCEDRRSGDRRCRAN